MMLSEPVVKKKLYFDEHKHQYTYGFTPKHGEVFISVTTLIGLFKPKFDSDYWSYYHALRSCLGIDDKKAFSDYLRRYTSFNRDLKNRDHINEVASKLDVTVSDLEFAQQLVLKDWDLIKNTATSKGTRYHNAVENKHYEDNGYEYDGVFIKLLSNKGDDLSELSNPQSSVIVPELRMFNEEFQIAGTMDQGIFHSNKTFDVNDWKTNKKIDKENKYQSMLGPLKHVPDCSFYHYSLQISVYAWMLKQFGYKPRLLKFTHIKMDEFENVIETIPYHVTYMEKEVIAMLNYYKENKVQLLNNKL